MTYDCADTKLGPTYGLVTLARVRLIALFLSLMHIGMKAVNGVTMRDIIILISLERIFLLRG